MVRSASLPLLHKMAAELKQTGVSWMYARSHLSDRLMQVSNHSSMLIIALS